MTEPHVTLGNAPEKLREPLEAQLSSALQRAAEIVANDYHGEPVEEVADRLLAEARSALHPDIAEAFQPDAAELRKVAEAVIRRAE